MKWIKRLFGFYTFDDIEDAFDAGEDYQFWTDRGTGCEKKPPNFVEWYEKRFE